MSTAFALAEPFWLYSRVLLLYTMLRFLKHFSVSLLFLFSIGCAGNNGFVIQCDKGAEIKVGADLIMNFRAIGFVDGITSDGDKTNISIKLEKNIRLGKNAVIIYDKPLLFDGYFKVINKGDSSRLEKGDTLLVHIKQKAKKDSAGDLSKVSKLLRTIADSLDAHSGKK